MKELIISLIIGFALLSVIGFSVRKCCHGSNACTVSSTCSYNCDTGWGNCDGVNANGCEQNLTNNNTHCGACNNPCSAGYQCVNSVCVASNTCTYGGSGNWFININDNCNLTTSNTITGNMYIYGATGTLNFSANQYANGYYYNVSTGGTWFYNNYRWLY